MSRPKKEYPPAKEKRVTVRLTEDLYDVLSCNAKKAKLSKAMYIRKLINGTTIKPLPVIIHDERDILQELRNINKLGNNLNQIARYLNQGGAITEPVLEEIKSVLRQLRLSINDFNLAVEKEYGSN